MQSEVCSAPCRSRWAAHAGRGLRYEVDNAVSAASGPTSEFSRRPPGQDLTCGSTESSRHRICCSSTSRARATGSPGNTWRRAFRTFPRNPVSSSADGRCSCAQSTHVFTSINCLIVSADRYIATTTLAIIAVFLEYLGQFLIDLHQIYRHSSVPKKHVSL